VKHQQFVGTGYFDAVQQVIASGTASTTALEGSTEAAQFNEVLLRPTPRNGHGPDAGCQPILGECPNLVAQNKTPDQAADSQF